MCNKSFSHTKLAIVISSLVAPFSATVSLASDALALEEIVVYAQKREQSIMEVPIAVSSYGAESLDRAQIRDTSELQQLSPSLSVTATTGSSDASFILRGVGTSGNNPGFEQSVGVFIDGVYRGRTAAALTDYFDVQSVEVLKGPQGTLFGRNTAAGVINVRTTSPSYEPSGTVELSAGNEGFTQVKGAATGPLVDDVLAYRLSGTWQERDGNLDNVTGGSDVYDKDRYSLKGQLLWDINDDASLRIISDYTKGDESCCTAVPIFYGPASQVLALTSGAQFLPGNPGAYAGQSGNFVDTFDREVALNTDNKEILKDWGVSGELEWDLGSTAVTALVSTRRSDNENILDVDYTAADALSRRSVIDVEENSIELRLQSTGANTVDWMTGIFYFDQKIDYKAPVPFGADAHVYFDTLSGVAANNLLGAAVAPATIPNLISVLEDSLGQSYFSDGDFSNIEADYEAESFAVFGQATWNIDDQLSLTVGLRYSNEEKEADYSGQQHMPYADLTAAQLANGFLTSTDPVISSLAAATVAPGVTGAEALTGIAQAFQFGPAFNDFTSKYDDENVSGAVSINYIWSEEFSTYARLARGYKAGGLSLDRSAGGQQPGDPSVDPEAPVFEAEILDSLEFGFKSQWLDGRLSVNGAIYYQELEDFQFQEFTGTGFRVNNAATVKGSGFELDYMYALNDHWRFSGGIAIQDIYYDEFEDGPTAFAQSEAGLAAQDLSGEPVRSSPDLSYSGSITYQNSLTSLLDWSAGVSYSYRSEYFSDVANEEILEQDASLLVNLVTTVESVNGDWAVDLWGKNVTDEEIYNAGVGTPFQSGSFSAYVNSGATWGVTLRAYMN